MEGACPHKILIPAYQATQSHIPEEWCENNTHIMSLKMTEAKGEDCQFPVVLDTGQNTGVRDKGTGIEFNLCMN